ncbi:SecDF P1 head subdomain-containing protein [Pollutimonas bauzanensis]|uniref:SecDF P1 head subdomain domain-containing protein n=1 Tax=Pollutimonas bauzanensis TaxID=658167 RepID=A0A1M5MHZ2_9BURK|nr:hypothetical protein [Pollutimonas bauzanensis]SHG76777.1 hypothetical protein SAMN04488135_101226 [Pollutimonas bauzanensis]
MKTIRTLGRILVPASLVVLAACQSVPGDKTVSQAPSTTTPQPETTLEAQRQGAPVAVFLADTALQTGWTPVSLQTGTLYVNPQPVITRADLSGIQAGTNKQGEGLLALELNEAGKKKVADTTAQNPNKRLALVVGRTMMAAPGYTVPVTTGQLIFAVGTEENATAAARAIAGASPEGGAPGTGAPASTTAPGGAATPGGASAPGASGAGAQ